MSADEYVPEEEDFIDSWACAHVTPHDMTAEEAKDAARAFLARVRRDAAREAMHALRTHLAASRGYQLIGPEGLDYYIHNHHPEETP